MIVVTVGEMANCKVVWRSDKDSNITIIKAREVIKILKTYNPDGKYRIFKLSIDLAEKNWKEEEIEVEE